MADPQRVGGSSTGGDEVSLFEMVSVLLRRWPVVAAAAVIVGLCTAVLLAVSVPEVWEGTATLVVSPPAVSSEVSPKPLSLQTYQRLLEADSVVAETRKRLVERGLIAATQPLRPGKELETRIFVSRKSEEMALAPVVLAIARGGTPQQAAEIANTWATVFLEEVRKLATANTSPTVDLIGREYDEARSQMATLEAQRLELVTSLARTYDGSADHLDREAARSQDSAAVTLADYRAETGRLLKEYESTRGIETRRAQIAALRQSLADLQSEQAHVAAELAQAQLRLEAGRAALAATPTLIEVHKAMSDDVLWQSTLADKDAAAPSAAAGRTLTGQEVNPVYSDLATTVAHLEIDAKALAPRAEQLARLIEEATATLREREIALARDDAGLAALDESRQAGLTSLLSDQAVEAAVQDRQRTRTLATLDGARTNAVAAADREIARQKDLLASLAHLQGEATLARTQTSVADVRLALPATQPNSPEPRRLVEKSAVATALGACIGVLLALALEARSRKARAGGV